MGIQIVITGPESVGKSSLGIKLSKLLGAKYVNEYARTYVENLERPYNFTDVEKIAQYQIFEYDNASKLDSVIIYDTFLEITKVWFEHVYHKIPIWFGRKFKERPVDLYLLCSPDIPWHNDKVRENGHIRDELFEQYKKVLQQFNCKYEVIEGVGDETLKNALEILEKYNIRPI